MLVAQRAGQAVDLRLGGKGERRVSSRPRKRRTRAQNSSTSSSAKTLPSDSIGTTWRTLANSFDGAAPTLRDSESGSGEFGKGRLQRDVAPAQRVVVAVGDRRRVFAVIAPVMPGDFRAEARVLGLRLVGRQLVRRFRLGAHAMKLAQARGDAEAERVAQTADLRVEDPHLVMAGLVPAIHAFAPPLRRQKSAFSESSSGAPAASPRG